MSNGTYAYSEYLHRCYKIRLYNYNAKTEWYINVEIYSYGYNVYKKFKCFRAPKNSSADVILQVQMLVGQRHAYGHL